MPWYRGHSHWYTMGRPGNVPHVTKPSLMLQLPTRGGQRCSKLGEALVHGGGVRVAPVKLQVGKLNMLNYNAYACISICNRNHNPG